LDADYVFKSASVLTLLSVQGYHTVGASNKSQYLLLVPFERGSILDADYVFDINHGSTSIPDDVGAVAVIDGSKYSVQGYHTVGASNKSQYLLLVPFERVWKRRICISLEWHQEKILRFVAGSNGMVSLHGEQCQNGR
jgi:hypothetical protein